MIKINYPQIIERIKEKSKLSEPEIEAKITKKLRDLSGLISKEGAAHIVANELGVRLFECLGKETIKIKDLLIGMRRINIVGKVTNVFSVNQFKTEKREGKVGSFIIGDETGRVRIVLWDERHIRHIENNELKEGTIVKIENAYVRENNNFKEMHLNINSNLLLNPEGVTIENVAEPKTFSVNKKEIKDLTIDDNFVDIIGTLVQLFEPRFYNVCDLCGKKVLLDGDTYRCQEHGAIAVKSVPVINFYFDDGTGNIRVVAFRDTAEKILGLNSSEVLELKDLAKFEATKDKVMGSQLKLSGRVTQNEMFDRIEFIANRIEEITPESLIKEQSAQ